MESGRTKALLLLMMASGGAVGVGAAISTFVADGSDGGWLTVFGVGGNQCKISQPTQTKIAKTKAVSVLFMVGGGCWSVRMLIALATSMTGGSC